MRPVISTVATGNCRRSELAVLLALALAATACSGKNKDDEEPEPQPGPSPPELAPPRAPTKATPLPADPGKHVGSVVWARSFGGADRDEAKAIDIDAAGNVAVAGIFTGEVDFGTGTKLTSRALSGFVGVLDPDGKPRWMVPLYAGILGKEATEATPIEPTIDVTVSDVVFDGKGNVAVVGWFSDTLDVGGARAKATGSDDAFVAVIAPTGVPLWVRALGGYNTEIAWSVDADAQGGLVIAGEKRGAADFGGGPFEAMGSADIFVVRLAPDGSHLWSHAWGDLGEDNGRAVAFDSKGDVILAAEMETPLDFGDGKPPAHKGKGDVAVLKLDPAGKLVWVRSFGNTFDDVVLGLAVDGGDNLLLSGTFEDKLKIGGDKLVAGDRADAYVVKLDPDGQPVWARGFGAGWEDAAAAVAADRYGNVVVTGWFQGKVDFGGDALEAPNGNMDGFLVKLSAEGRHLWSRRFGDRDHDRGRALAVAPEGNIALAGIYRFTLDLQGALLQSVRKPGDKIAPADAFFARFAP